METLVQDVRYTLKQLWAARGLTAMAVLTLALGIGSNAALYTVLRSVLLRPLPYAHPERLVYIGPWEDVPSFSNTSWLNYRDIRDQAQTLQALSAYVPDLSVVEIDGQATSTIGVQVTPNTFAMLGVKPLLGRTFTEAEGIANGPHVAVLSESLWRHRFQADPHVLGRSIRIGGTPQTIVGVMPDSFRFPENGTSGMEDGLWTPLQPTGIMLGNRGWNFLEVVGKLRSGVALGQAQADLNAVTARMRKADPDERDKFRFAIEPYQNLLTASVRPAFYALLAAVGLVLLISCANVANLLIARFLGRRQEFAIRVALGAGRPRLVWQLLIEGALLSVAGCLLGIALAASVLTLVHKLPDGTLPRSNAIGMDWTILLALGFTATVTTLLSSLLPALLAARTDPQAVLQASSRGLSARGGSSQLSRWLVIGEVALASLLLVGTGLLFHTLWNLEHAQLGFNPDQVTTFDVMPSDSAGLTSMAAAPGISAGTSVAVTVYGPLLAQMQAQPGIKNAALVTMRPLSGFNLGTSFDIVGEPKSPTGRSAGLTAISPGYTATMGIAVLRGRTIQDSDTASAAPVALINKAFADKYFAGKDPLGRSLDIGGKETGMDKPCTIVGVLANQTHQEIGAPADPLILLPYEQVPTGSLFYQGLLRTIVSFAVKTRGNVPTASEMRSVFHQYAPGYALNDFETMQDSVNGALFSQRLSLWLTAAFAGLAILMVVVGLYGVLAQLVGYRRHEIGIRMALGATRGSMARMILRQGGMLIGTGLAAGLILSALFGQLVRSFLYQVAPLDLWAYAGVVLVSLPVGLLASLAPAWRAASIEPMQALREE